MCRGAAICALRQALPQQQQDVTLAGDQQRVLELRSVRIGQPERHQLQPARGEMDRVDELVPVRFLGRARAGAEREQLRGLDVRQSLSEQHEARLWVSHAELADPAEASELADVEDQHRGTVGSQHDREAVVRDVVGDDRHVWVNREQESGAERDQIVETGDRNVIGVGEVMGGVADISARLRDR